MDLKVFGTMTDSAAANTSYPQCSKISFPLKGTKVRYLIPGLGQDIYKMSLECFLIPDNMEAIKGY